MAFRSTLLRSIESQGTREEVQLVARWRPQIERFLEVFSEDLQRDLISLEIGLEKKLALKLIVKRYRITPAAGLLRMLDSLPELPAACAREALTRRLDFHVGLRIQPDRCHRELYIYDRDNHLRSFLAARMTIPEPPPGTRFITAFGIDEYDGISAYLTIRKNPRVMEQFPRISQALEAELRTSLGDHAHDLWEHLRLQNGEWRSKKFGIELVRMDLPLATRIISHYRPPHFRYLVPFADYSAIVIAGDESGGVGGWYFTRASSRQTDRPQNPPGDTHTSSQAAE